MRTIVKKWGNSAAVRLPASVMEAARLSLDSAVTVHVEAGRVVIEAVSEPEYDLDSLLAGITDENLHAATDWGDAAGREII